VPSRCRPAGKARLLAVGKRVPREGSQRRIATGSRLQNGAALPLQNRTKAIAAGDAAAMAEMAAQRSVQPRGSRGVAAEMMAQRGVSLRGDGNVAAEQRGAGVEGGSGRELG
jgi:hypothetical protein